MRGVTIIQPSWISLIGKALCNFSEPLETPPPLYKKNKK